MASAISQSSVATVVEDIVADRSILIKVCMIVLNTAQMVSCVVAIIIFIANPNRNVNPLDLPVSAAFFLVGCYLIPNITNGVIYFLRWKRSSSVNRRKMEEENKQAWVCLRITLTLIGLPTVGRYIETIIVSIKLDKLEKEHMHSSLATQRELGQLHPKSSSKLGSMIESNIDNQHGRGRSGAMKNSVISGISQSSATGMTTQGYRKVRRAKRQYKRCEHDGALLSLVTGSAGAGPMAVVFCFLYLQRIEKLNWSHSEGAIVIIAFVLNLIWLSATLTQFYPARHVQSEAEFERGIRVNHIIALIIVYMSHVVQTTLRVIILGVFTNWFYAYVLIPVVLQWLVGTVSFIAYRQFMRPKTVGVPLDQRMGTECTSILSSIYYGFVGIFDFVNGNQGKTRLRYLIYYAFYYAENIAMLVIWIVLKPNTQIQFPVPFVAVLLSLFWVGFGLMQIYLYFFSQSPYGTSIFGFCCGNKRGGEHEYENNRRNSLRYAEEIRDPVFGVPLSETAIPLTPSNRRSNAPSSIASRPLPSIINGRGGPHSIMSSRSPPSILSNPGSQPHVQIHQRHAPTNKLPPVMHQKIRMAPPNLTLATVNSQSSSEDDDDDDDNDVPVFSPKAKISQSNPDLTMPRNPYSFSNSTTITDTVSNTDPEIQNKFTAVPSRLPNAKSVDRIDQLTPAIQPANTKPITSLTASHRPPPKYTPTSNTSPYRAPPKYTPTSNTHDMAISSRHHRPPREIGGSQISASSNRRQTNNLQKKTHRIR